MLKSAVEDIVDGSILANLKKNEFLAQKLKRFLGVDQATCMRRGKRVFIVMNLMYSISA